MQKNCSNAVLHLNFSESKAGLKNTNWEGLKVTHKTIRLYLNRWRVKEELASLFLKKFLRQYAQDYDIINFYIAYPNAIKIDQFKKKYPKIKFIISEQWSAYHTDFGLEKDSSGRERIANIFKHNTPLIVVSEALGIDICKFSNQPKLAYSVVPNILDTETFQLKRREANAIFTFTSINNWSPMKNPFLLIEAFHLIHKKNNKTRLILAGSGSLDEKIKNKIIALNLSQVIEFRGRINKEQVAQLLNESDCYCQSSNYETFSVICIEALATGTPVIATNIGGMKDFIHAENGLLVNEMTPKGWGKAMEKLMFNQSLYNAEVMSTNITKRYNNSAVGELYYATIKNLSNYN